MHTDTQPQLGRRQFVKTLANGALVVGFNTVTGAWVTSAPAASERTLLNVPPLDGTLYIDEATRNEYGQDFGQIVFEQPLAVLKPGSMRDISRMIHFARRHNIRVVGRGRGHTVFGQSQAPAGIVIDVGALTTIHTIDNDRAVVDVGARWHTLLQATLDRGLRPPVLTDYIGQSVGGTLSVGGIGGTMYRDGAQVDNVLELVVVTGEGQIVRCSQHKQRGLFEAALAGQGQCAVIVRATIKLVPAHTNIRVFNLIYADLETMTDETTRLMDEERFDFFEGWALPQGDGQFVYMMQAGSSYTLSDAPDNAALLKGLHDIRAALHIEDTSFWAWASRVPLELPRQPHPWIDLILPYPAINQFVQHVERTLTPLASDDTFSILLIPMRTDRFSRPLFRAPDAPHAFGFGILRSSPYDADVLEQIVAFNATLFDHALSLHGTHYPISAVRLDHRDWQRHYGAQWDRLVTAKRRYDPDNVLASGPDIFS